MKMKLSGLLTVSIALALAFLGLELPASAQSTRTWVSGVGDDANPGSRTAPCKTLAGAISKTAASGEIDTLDSGGFGSLTITKAMTIDGLGELASVLVAGTPAFFIEAGSNDVVTIRNFSLNGLYPTAGAGTYGINIISAGQVVLENCEIFGFTTAGVNFSPTASSAPKLFLHNCHIYNCAGSGVYVQPAAGVAASVVIDNSQIERCALGVHADANSTVLIHKCSIAQNAGAGVQAVAGGVVNIEDSQITQNGAGISSAGTVTISGVTVTGNTGAGLSASGGGSISTYHNNRISGNTPDGAPTGSLPYR
ncbi:MAG TPA: right-handed parallel beta-helix repeat-containing protein [Verrucomicrobiae bacterium]|jgi:hypothetical protein|nr:right-handed parallel beta-helix repeat-containing protein [Verrucomicrobiae bacterium]